MVALAGLFGKHRVGLQGNEMLQWFLTFKQLVIGSSYLGVGEV